MGMKLPKRPTESKPGWQGRSDWQLADRFDKDRPVLLLPGSEWSGQLGTSQSLKGQDSGISRHVVQSTSNAQCRVVKEFGKDFYKMQRGRSGRCLECKGGIRTTKQKNHHHHHSSH